MDANYWADASMLLRVVIAAAVILAAGLGFVAGYLYGRGGRVWEFIREGAGFLEVFETSMKALDHAIRACEQLERVATASLVGTHSRQIEHRRERLTELFVKLLRFQRVPTAVELPATPAGPVAEAVPTPEAIANQKALVAARLEKLEWQKSGLDPLTGLPDRPALEANLRLMQATSKELRAPSSVILARVDRLSTLRDRVGKSAADLLLRKFIHIVCKHVRDADYVGTFQSDTVAILLPGMDMETSGELARKLRDAVRSHNFQVDTGAEVMLTASLGCTVSHPDENYELVLDRAQAALNRSQRVGRNQLHLHDGQQLQICAAAS